MPAWGAPADPGGGLPPKKRRLIWFLIPVLIVFLVSSTVVTVFAVKLYEQPIDATNQYFADIRAGRYEDAFQQLCATRRFGTTVSAFAATEKRANDARPIDSYDFIGLDFPKNDNSPTDIITTGTVTRNGFDHDTRVGLVREDDEWRVCTVEED
jgi:hypothetical protein